MPSYEEYMNRSIEIANEKFGSLKERVFYVGYCASHYEDYCDAIKSIKCTLDKIKSYCDTGENITE